MRVFLYPHGGSGNHGCEAIIRSTTKVLSADYVLISSSPDQDLKYQLNTCCSIINDLNPIDRRSSSFCKAWLQYHLMKDKDAFDRLAFRDALKIASECDIALSIGGDNYCYGVPERLYFWDREIIKNNTKTILWGASIEPSSIDNRMLNDLSSFSHIFAREGITYNLLKRVGLTSVSHFPDPAFILGSKQAPLPIGFIKNNTVGINLSPMIIGREINKGIVFKNYSNLIKHILNDTHFSIALIPHVVWSSNDDRVPLMRLYNLFKDTGRVVLVDDRSAEELKYIISNCRFMVVARTHASIAAYSSKIPTLVVGYSVKARGIAEDIFGTSENYVVPVQLMNDVDVLVRAFDWMRTQEDAILSCYESIIPSYVSQLSLIEDSVSQICGR